MKGKATAAFINNERKNSKGKDVCTYIKATVRRIALEKKNKAHFSFLWRWSGGNFQVVVKRKWDKENDIFLCHSKNGWQWRY